MSGATCEKCGRESAHHGYDCIYSTAAGLLCPDCMYEVIEQQAAELERLREELKEAKFRPLGDNHHNAAECPYCSGPVLDENERLRKKLNQAEEEIAGLKDYCNKKGW